ncbi:bromodomain protein (macronuclear) [Tetrahymena thermophila SB210]|uniref:Bromodomain protein n=1 Tax=Tetrahymena thermophila (strain SB210) TaxID=312017 RepID=I7M858_TETTS|nr:bromodomain protein [Tetrahymena thermophila SB210]EAR97217.2 bromodomain protein [Tetrahymena thermophila SB210]|eukprot:XP_001017462.2 bromodomain protein [Tetrahymena thermophila SB210]
MSAKIKSTLKFVTETSTRKEDYKKMNTVLQSLFDNSDSLEFRQPVDYLALGLTDYPNVVKKPMDLSTVKNKINTQSYDTIEDFLDDIQLIWDNCKLYNAQGSWIWKLADKLDKYYKKLIKNYLPMVQVQQTVGKKEKKDDKASKQQDVYIDNFQEEKSSFTAKIKQLTEEQLGSIVEQIRLENPQAFIRLDNKKLQVIVDSISFESLQNYNTQIDNWLIPVKTTNKRSKNN